MWMQDRKKADLEVPGLSHYQLAVEKRLVSPPSGQATHDHIACTQQSLQLCCGFWCKFPIVIEVAMFPSHRIREEVRI